MSNNTFSYCFSCPNYWECDFKKCIHDICDKPIYENDKCDNCHNTPICFPDLIASPFSIAHGKAIGAIKTRRATKRNTYKDYLKRNNID